MTGTVILTRGLHDVVPHPLALHFGPAVVPLKHWNDELGRAVNDLGELPVYGMHVFFNRKIWMCRISLNKF